MVPRNTNKKVILNPVQIAGRLLSSSPAPLI
jgi:hypothetical protein